MKNQTGETGRDDALKLVRAADCSRLKEAVLRLLDRQDSTTAGMLRKKLETSYYEEAGSVRSEKKANRTGRRDASYKPGDRCGPYRIKEFLGSGGMGTVYLAACDGDLGLDVALKTLSGWSPAILRLFKAECKTLSSLKHSGIAQLIDVGQTTEGQPWMAMEYVPGLTLDAWCKKNKPDRETCFDVFLKICDALSHAHRQMIIHRDLKPGNIIVTPEGTPKLLDFGIASLLDPDTGQEEATTWGTKAVMTPEYASPEQINGTRLSAASDVYSLGVLLYEMITGVRPREFNSHHRGDLIKTIRETRIRRVSSFPRPGPTRLWHTGNDLDTIMFKALEKESARRYPSVEALAGDLIRYRAGLPIQARPATLVYRLGKLVRRHPWPMATAAMLVCSFIIFTLYGSHQRHLIATERDLARQEQQTADSVTGFLVSLFKNMDPESPGEITAFEVLEMGRHRIDKELVARPGVRIRLLGTMGRVYHALGRHEPATALLQKAIALGTSLEMDTSEDVFSLIRSLQASGDLAEAERQLEQLAKELQNKNTPSQRSRLYRLQGNQQYHRGLFKTTDQYYQQALAAGGLSERELLALKRDQARLYEAWGYAGRAIETLIPVLQEQRQHHGEIHSQVARTLVYLGRLQTVDGSLEDARRNLMAAEEIMHQLYDQNHPQLAELFMERSRCLIQQGDYNAAEVDAKRACEKIEASLGDKHPLYAESLTNLADVLKEQGRLDEAEQLYRQTLNIVRGSLGQQHPDVSIALNNLALLMFNKGDLIRTEDMLREVLRVYYHSLGEVHPEVGNTLNNLALLHKVRGELDSAEELYLKALEVKRACLGNRHISTASTLSNLGRLLQARGDLDGAEPYAREALEIRRRVLGEENNYFALSLNNLADLLLLKGRFDEARPLIEQSLAINRKTLPADHFRIHIAENIYGAILVEQGAFKQGVEHLLRSYQALSRVRGAKSHYTGEARSRLRLAYEKAGLEQEASRYRESDH